MAKGWEQDHEWGRRFLPEMKRIVGQYLIAEAPATDDQTRNTDLIVLNLSNVRVACRVRKFSYLDKYGDQFTIRAGRPNGTPTELHKVVAGWGDYILYAFANQNESALAAWVLGDLKVFRLYFNTCLARNRGAVPGFANNNRDGSSSFRAFRISDLPPAFVVARCLYRQPERQTA
jgi:hypothetical protein